MRSVILYRKPIFILLAVFFTVSLYSSEVFYNKIKYTIHPKNIIYKIKEVSNSFSNNKNTTDSTSCILKKIDPFDDVVWEFLEPMMGENQRKTCNKEFIARTILKNGQLLQMDNNDSCSGRCLHYTFSIKTYGWDEWISLKRNHTFDCDVIESLCSKTNDFSNADYQYIHTQIREKPENKRFSANKSSTTNNKKYSVLLIVLDSTSSPMSNRYLPTTMNYLRDEMGAVEFKYLNRVGHNSKPNAAALILGKRSEHVSQFDSESPKWEYDFNLSEVCDKELDEYPPIYTNFSDEGYVTFSAEDEMSVFNYPTCKGFQKHISDHTSQPYAIAWEYGPQLLKDTMKADNCDDIHGRLVNYLEQFVRSYKGIPKFGHYWDVNWAHRYPMDLSVADIVLHKFFSGNKEYLKDTFVFISGDHGPRFGDFMKTKLAPIEINNPMLVIVPPQELRENEELMETLRENSEKLQTHWDTRATLMDILKHQPISNFWDRTALNASKDGGSSMLRRQDGERSCRTLPIPLQYCLCRYPTVQKYRYTKEALYYANLVIDSVTEKLKEHKVSHLCNNWDIDQVVELTETSVLNTELYQIKIAMKRPSGAEFQTIVSKSNGSLFIGTVDRLDAYKERGNCVPYHLERFCDCL